jgi:hypothetical protein
MVMELAKYQSDVLNGFLSCVKGYPDRSSQYFRDFKSYLYKGLKDSERTYLASNLKHVYVNIDPKYLIPLQFNTLETLCMFELLIKFFRANKDMSMEADGLNNSKFRLLLSGVI